MAFVLMTVDMAWIFFAWACIQEGAREGVRYAVTGQVLSKTCETASIDSVIEKYSFGFVNSKNAASAISIQYYSPTNLTTPLTGSTRNAGGNVVKVVVGPITVGTFGPIFRHWQPIHLTARFMDVMEGSPNGTPPCL